MLSKDMIPFGVIEFEPVAHAQQSFSNLTKAAARRGTDFLSHVSQDCEIALFHIACRLLQIRPYR